MKGVGEQKEQDEEAVVEGKYSECAAAVKVLEEVGLIECVKEDAGDEEAGEDKEEVDANVA